MLVQPMPSIDDVETLDMSDDEVDQTLNANLVVPKGADGFASGMKQELQQAKEEDKKIIRGGEAEQQPQPNMETVPLYSLCGQCHAGKVSELLLIKAVIVDNFDFQFFPLKMARPLSSNTRVANTK